MGMRRVTFEESIEKVFAIFGKNTPPDRVLDLIFNRIEHLPDDFMSFVVRHFEDQLDLPKNMGFYILRQIWPDYLQAHPELKAKNQYCSCPRCANGLPGWRHVWEPIYTQGRHTYVVRVVRCPCGNAPNPNNEHIPSDEELLALGWQIHMPFCIWLPGLPRNWRSIIPLGEIEDVRPDPNEPDIEDVFF